LRRFKRSICLLHSSVIFPILLISLSVASWFLGKQQGIEQRIIELTAEVLQSEVIALVASTLEQLINQGFGAGILGQCF